MRVGFYTGTFDPVTEGHINVAVAAMRRLDLLFFVPNPENPSKNSLLDLETRSSLIRRRCAMRDLSTLKFSVHDTTGMTLDWQGRTRVSDHIAKEVSRVDKCTVEMVQVIGSDSFNTAGCQRALATPEIRLNLRRKFMVFMREGSSAVIIPGQLAGLVEVPAYADKAKNSSTEVRRMLNNGDQPHRDMLHPALYDIIKKKLASRKRKTPEIETPLTILLVGGPASGKTTLGRALAEHIGGVAVSTGEIYALGKDLRLPNWPTFQHPPESVSWKLFDEKSAECIQILVKDMQDKHLIVDGISAETPEKVKQFTGRSVDVIVELDCDWDTMIYRMAQRGRPGEEVEETRQARAEKYLKRQWKRASVLQRLPRDIRHLVLRGALTTEAMVQRAVDTLNLSRSAGGTVISDIEVREVLTKVCKSVPAVPVLAPPTTRWETLVHDAESPMYEAPAFDQENSPTYGASPPTYGASPPTYGASPPFSWADEVEQIVPPVRPLPRVTEEDEMALDKTPDYF